jgi:tetratricopeptide (TPR) repeat protein
MRKVLKCALVALTTIVAASCARDPNMVKREHVQRGDVYMAEKKYHEAIIEYRGAVQADPRFGEARKKLGEAYVKTDDPAGAFSEYVRAADLLPDDVDVQLKTAGLLQLAGRFEDAKARAEQALKKAPGNIDAQLLVGSALLGLKDPDAAIAQIQEATRLDPGAGRL